jgi:hypothetical protein
MTSTPDTPAADSNSLGIIDEICQWQLDAQQLPLPDVRGLADSLLMDLALSLDAFNDACLRATDSCACDQCYRALAHALVYLVRTACMSAIFTLGTRQRSGVLLPELN